MQKFNRELQRYLLTVCIGRYPEYTFWTDYDSQKIDVDDNTLWANMVYLAQHGLIQIDYGDNTNPFEHLEKLKATAKGVDFMLNDGGLSAILSVQTIKLHRETVTVLEDLIAISNMTNEQKDKAKSALGDMSIEAIKSVVQTITTAGISALLVK
ncbi:hypothetical protein NGK65_06530 [Serratia ureilytica]|uniref:hypothetical protein n=1 Tax=Serratia ureilytica TaxID=300181 RepID=UPI002DBF15F8|nr:hypothetical protein [Serratia ureilytica]MEB7893390.1 hypothetical protein [Serratia ureilytica]